MNSGWYRPWLAIWPDQWCSHFYYYVPAYLPGTIAIIPPSPTQSTLCSRWYSLDYDDVAIYRNMFPEYNFIPSISKIHKITNWKYLDHFIDSWIFPAALWKMLLSPIYSNSENVLRSVLLQCGITQGTISVTTASQWRSGSPNVTNIIFPVGCLLPLIQLSSTHNTHNHH